MIPDDAWTRALATLPPWCRARHYASTGTVELEFDRDECSKPYNDVADVRAMFFLEVGGDWTCVDREHRFKTVVCFYKRSEF